MWDKPKPKHEVRYREIEVNIGKTVVEIQFSDGRKFLTTVYGEAGQRVYSENGLSKGSKAFVDKVYVEKSIEVAKRLIRNLKIEGQIFLNDTRNPTESAAGIVVSAKILETFDLIEKFPEGYLEVVK
jgi:hypothetical protein